MEKKSQKNKQLPLVISSEKTKIQISGLDVEMHRIFHLKSIKLEKQFDIARINGYDGKKVKKDLLDYFVEKMDTKEFMKLFEDDMYSSRSTNLIYVLEKDSEELLDYFKDHPDILQNLDKTHAIIDSIKEEKLFIDNVKFLKSSKELRFNIRAVKLREVVESYDEEKDEEGFWRINRIENFPVRLYLDKRIMIIRCNIKGKAEKLQGILEQKDPIFKAHLLFFNDANKEAVFSGNILRGARFAFGNDEEVTSSESFHIGAKKNSKLLQDLNTLERFKEASKEGKLNIITMAVPKDGHNARELTEDDALTMLINFDEAKIFFYAFLDEDAIKKWIINIIEKCDLELNDSLQDEIDELK